MESQSTPELNKALAKAKADFPKILENRRVKINTKTGREIQFTYSELEEIAEAVTPTLSVYGLVIVSQTVFLGDKFCLMTTLRHESGESLASYFLLPNDAGSDPKELGGKISYGRRYNTICLLEITTVEPSNADQRGEQVRKLARDIKTEAGMSSKSQSPPKRGDTSFLEAIEGNRPTQAAPKQEITPQDLYPANNDIVKRVRALTKHEPHWILAQCRHYGYDRPGMIPPDELSKLIADMCVDWAVGTGVIGDHQKAHTSIQGALAFASASGQSVLGGAIEWLNRHGKEVSV